MFARSSSVRLLLVLAALTLLLLPLPPQGVERWYSAGVYPHVQRLVTPATNLVPFALFDVAFALALAAAAWRLVRQVRRAGVWRGGFRALIASVVAAAAIYLAFLMLWGLNYQRLPLEARLDYDEARVTVQAARDFAAAAVGEVNGRRAAALQATGDDSDLARAFEQTQRALGAGRPAAVGRPKPSLLGLYFRHAAIDGMTNPFFLEIILNPDLLPVERPMVLAHEWAHLAGFAHETEANFVAWLTCLQGDAMARYSAWLAAYQHVASALSRDDRRALPPLDEGPRQDLRAIAARYQRSTPVVRTAARDVYDSYLRAHRVPEGVASYGAVVRLMLGTQLDDELRPRPGSR